MINQKSKIKDKRYVSKIKKFFGFFIYVFYFSFFIFNLSNAQTSPKFLVSWRATNYIPADYQGKIFPSKTSKIEIGFDLIDGNKIVDLSKYTIRWSLDNNNLASGVGLKTVSFNASKPGGSDHIVRISVANYKGAEIEQILTIPVANPEIVFDIKNPVRRLSVGANTIRALPYFFNVNNLENLSFNWLQSGKAIEGKAGNPDFLALNIESQGQPVETLLNITVTVKNLFSQLELAIKNINLLIK